MNLKSPKQELHHWFPRGMQRRWADPVGKKLSRVNAAGAVCEWSPHSRRRKAAKHGAIKGGHFIDLGDSPFARSFEHSFGKIDHRGATFLDLLDAFIKSVTHDSNSAGELIKFLASRPNFVWLWAASLLLRSPGTREGFHQSAAAYGAPPCNNVASSSIESYWERAKYHAGIRAGKRRFGIYVSKGAEFYFGEGLSESFIPSLQTSWVQGGCYIPILPNACLWIPTPQSERKSFISYCDDTVVLRIKKFTAHASCKELFYRSQKPSDEFIQMLGVFDAYPSDCAIQSDLAAIYESGRQV